MNKKPKKMPPQHQDREPGLVSEMNPKPLTQGPGNGCGKLTGKVALITGGDSGIGRAVAVAFAKEGADVAFAYLNEHEEVAPSYVFLASEDSSYMTGQILHPNGGEIVNG